MAVTGVVATSGGLLAACTSSSKSTATNAAAAKPKRGGNLKVGLAGGSSSDTLDPHQGLTYLDTGRFEALYQPLVKLDKSAEVEYVLAESTGRPGRQAPGKGAQWTSQTLGRSRARRLTPP